MAKIRADLIGAVHVGGHVLFAGDTVPKDVTVGSHLAVDEPKQAPKPVQDAAEPVEAPEPKTKPKRGRPRKKPAEDTGDATVD